MIRRLIKATTFPGAVNRAQHSECYKKALDINECRQCFKGAVANVLPIPKCVSAGAHVRRIRR